LILFCFSLKAQHLYNNIKEKKEAYTKTFEKHGLIFNRRNIEKSNLFLRVWLEDIFPINSSKFDSLKKKEYNSLKKYLSVLEERKLLSHEILDTLFYGAIPYKLIPDFVAYEEKQMKRMQKLCNRDSLSNTINQALACRLVEARKKRINELNERVKMPEEDRNKLFVSIKERKAQIKAQGFYQSPLVVGIDEDGSATKSQITITKLGDEEVKAEAKEEKHIKNSKNASRIRSFLNRLKDTTQSIENEMLILSDASDFRDSLLLQMQRCLRRSVPFGIHTFSYRYDHFQKLKQKERDELTKQLVTTKLLKDVSDVYVVKFNGCADYDWFFFVKKGKVAVCGMGWNYKIASKVFSGWL
ncbi:MAG: hypothetical protein H7Y04_02080, partial [Verrucomicrobia bacterium]|nr:hypothetical protein [Cytophagales bacterium]